MTAQSSSAYALSRAYLLRVLGVFTLAAGILVLVWAVVSALEAESWLTTSLLALVAAVVAAGLLAALAIAAPPTLLLLDDRGFQVKWVRGAGLDSGSWSHVTGVTTRRSPNGLVMVLVHSVSGGHTRVPLSVLDAPPVEVEDDVRRRLDCVGGSKPTRLHSGTPPENVGGSGADDPPNRSMDRPNLD